MVLSKLGSGTYTIVNKRYSNAARLTSDIDGDALKARASDGSDYCKWIITKLDNGRFTVKNLQTKQFANVEADLGDDMATVDAKGQAQEWKIVGTGITDVFRIASTEASGRYWGLSSSAGGTPIELRNGSTGPDNQWIIKSTTPSGNVLQSTTDIPFDLRLSDRDDPLNLSLQQWDSNGRVVGYAPDPTLYAPQSRKTHARAPTAIANDPLNLSLQQWDSNGRVVGYAPDPTLYAPQPRKTHARAPTASSSHPSSQTLSPGPYMSERNDGYTPSAATLPSERSQQVADQNMDVSSDATPVSGRGDDWTWDDKADTSWKCGQCSGIFELSHLAKIHFLLTHAILSSSAVPAATLSSIERTIQVVDRTPGHYVYKDILGIIAQQLWSKLVSAHARKDLLASECYPALLRLAQDYVERAAKSEVVDHLVRVSRSRREILDLAYNLDLGGDHAFEDAITREEKRVLQLFEACLKSGTTAILALRDTPATNMLDLLDFILHPASTTLPDRYHFRASLASQSTTLEKAMRRTFVRLSEASLQTPSRLYLSGVHLADRQAVKSGSYGAIYQGRYGEYTVALKSLYRQLDPKEIKVYCREVAVLRGLTHPNVCPLIGIDSQSLHPNTCIVMPWMTYGTVVEYLSACGWSEADATRLICQVSSALAYLHGEGIAHGDLHVMNVLVDETRCVRLTDFGLANFADAGASAGTIMAGAARYMAPEILGPDLVQPAKNQDNLPAGGIRHTSASDMFSFGQVAWHIYTEKEPYAGMSTHQACFQILSQQYPKRSSSARRMSDSLWQTIEACWAYKPSSRPTAVLVHSHLEKLIHGAASPY